MTIQNGPGGGNVPEIASGDFVFRSLVRSIQAMRRKGTLSDDDAFTSIMHLTTILVEAAIFERKLPFDVTTLSDGETELAFDRLTADVLASVGEPEMAHLYLKERTEFDRRCEAGTSLEKSVLA